MKPENAKDDAMNDFTGKKSLREMFESLSEEGKTVAYCLLLLTLNDFSKGHNCFEED